MRALKLLLIFAESGVFDLEGLELTEVLGALRIALHGYQAVNGLLGARQSPCEAAMALDGGGVGSAAGIVFVD